MINGRRGRGGGRGRRGGGGIGGGGNRCKEGRRGRGVTINRAGRCQGLGRSTL